MELNKYSHPWRIGAHKDEVNDNSGVLVCLCSKDNGQDEIDAAAIVSAVNNTFGKGFDPEKVEEMYRMLKRLAQANVMIEDDSQILSIGVDEYEELEQLLTSAKL